MDDEKFLHAKKVYLEKKFEEANSLFSEIIASTNNYKAIIYKGFNKAYQTTLETPLHAELVSSLKEGYSVVRSKELNKEEYINNNLEIISEINNFIIYSIKMYLDKFTSDYNEYINNKKKIEDYNKFSGEQTDQKYVEKQTKEIEEKYSKAKNDYLAGISLTAVAYTAGMEIVLYDVMNTKEEIYTLENYNTILSITKSLYSRFKDSKLGEPLLSKVKSIYDFCADKVAVYQGGKNTEYWNNHQEEKKKLEDEIEESKKEIENKTKEIEALNEEKSKLTLDLNTSLSYNKQQEVKKQLEGVNSKLSQVGVLNIKAKKELTEEKTKLEDIIRRLDNNIKSEKEEADSKFNSQKKAIDNKINQLQNDIINLKRKIDNNEKLLSQNR